MADLRINILGRNDHNKITDRSYPDFKGAAARLKPTGGSLASKNVRIVIEPSAASSLFESIGWGQKYKRGDVEQAGILIGHYYRDRSAEEEVVWADVVAVIPADPTLVNASFENIDITADAWKQMYDDADELHAENLQIVGWYHTHLDNINTRFSGVDTRTQRKAFTYEYSFGVVFNPNQEKWSAFYGPDSRGCVGDLIYDEALEIRYGRPKITIRQVNGDSELKKDGSVVHLDESGQPIENRPPAPRTDARSFGQIAGQFFVELGKLMAKSPKEPEPHRPPEGGEAPKPAVRTEAGETQRAGDASPRIEIRSIPQGAPTVSERYYTMTPDNKIKEQQNFRCSINKSDVDEIIKYRQRCIEQNRYLWADIRQINEGMELTLVDEQRANAKIVFSKNNLNREINETVAMGFQLSSGPNIRFVVLIDSVSTLSIDIRVIRFSREYVI